jgi:hypothetical protein
METTETPVITPDETADAVPGNVLTFNAKAKVDEPVAVFNHVEERWEDSTDRVPVFSVITRNPRAGMPIEGGDHTVEGIVYEPETITTTYTMPRRPNAGFALAYMSRARYYSVEEVLSWIIEHACGQEALEALAIELGHAGEQGKDIMRATARKIQGIAAGGLDKTGPKG